MEFEFIRNTLMGEYYVKSSMGHEVVGQWLQEEIGKDWSKIEQVEQLIITAKAAPQQEYSLLGKEVSLMIQGDEVSIQQNALHHCQPLELESEFDFYDSESVANCGIDDFAAVITQWKAFLMLK